MIRWILERLGTAPYETLEAGTQTILDVRHLVDKRGNPSAPLAELIHRGAQAYRGGETVVVACDFGVSRSNAVAAGILAVLEDIPYDNALNVVVERTGEREIKIDMADAVRMALAEPTSELTARDAVLMTGASGFLGRNLLAKFGALRTVLSPSRANLDLEDGAVSLARYCQRKGVGHIMHLAHPRIYTNAAASSTSLLMLRNVLEVCRSLRIRLTYVSGWVVFAGYATTSLLANESTPLSPKGVYGETKFLEEQLIRVYIDRDGLDCAICRLGPVYGPGADRPRLIKAFHEAIKSGSIVTTHLYRNGRPALDLLHVDDAVNALILAAESSHRGVLHFGSGEMRTTAEIAEAIAQIVGVPFAHEELAIDDFTSNISLDSRRAKQLLGWMPKISLESGLCSTLSYSEQS